MRNLITICARGGSKGIPGKNILPIAGKPLIAYSIDVAIKYIDHYQGVLALSTDCPKIKEVASSYGLQTSYTRPSYLASDTAGKIDTIRDILIYEENLRGHTFDYILDLDVTSPLRNVFDLQNAFKLLHDDKNALNIFSVNEANRNPYFNMVERNENGYYDYVKKNESGVVMARQSAPKVFDMNASFYWYRRSFFNKNFKSAVTPLSLIYKMNHICFDLDHQIDFDFLTYLMLENKLTHIL